MSQCQLSPSSANGVLSQGFDDDDNNFDDLFGNDQTDIDNLFDEEESTPCQLSQSVSSSSENHTSGRATPASTATSFTTCPYNEDPQYGLRWGKDTFSLIPTWTIEPTIESIVQTLQARIARDKTYHVRHWRNGRYNKFYLVTYEDTHFVMKVTLPICPSLKTESEIATLRWIYLNTELPVPKVKCYDSSRNNPIGFEWILMDRVEGGPLSDCWSNIPDGSLERIIKQIAQYAAKAFEKQFSGGICNIYPPTPNSCTDDPQPGELVWMPFFWGERGYLDYPRGPFHSTSSWNENRLKFAYSNLTETMQFMRRGIDQKKDWKVGCRMLKLINRLRELGPKFHPEPVRANESTPEQRQNGNERTERTPEPTMLWHDNLSLDNIFVDRDFVLTGILDWECVSCLPLPQACHLPAFLQMRGTTDTELPHTEPTEYSYIDDNFRLPPLTSFYRDVRQYQISACRRIFLEEMETLSPEWLETYRRSADQRDFEAAVQNCDNEFAYERVERWVDAMEEDGKAPGDISPRLHEKLFSD